MDSGHGEFYMVAGDPNNGFDVGIMQLRRSVSPPVTPITLNKEPNDMLNLPMKDVPSGDTLTFIGYGAQVRFKQQYSSSTALPIHWNLNSEINFNFFVNKCVCKAALIQPIIVSVEIYNKSTYLK